LYVILELRLSSVALIILAKQKIRIKINRRKIRKKETPCAIAILRSSQLAEERRKGKERKGKERKGKENLSLAERVRDFSRKRADRSAL